MCDHTHQATQQRVVVELSPMPSGPGAPDASIRLRRLLKIARRAFGFRCVEVREQSTIRTTPRTTNASARDEPDRADTRVLVTSDRSTRPRSRPSRRREGA